MGQSQAKLNELLLEAVSVGNMDGADRLIKTEGASVENSKDKWGRGPVHIAAYHGNERMLALLLTATKNGTRLPELHQAHRAWSRDHAGRTPLHEAAQMGHVDCGQLLLLQRSMEPPRHKRDKNTPALIDASDQSGTTALHLAASNGHKNFAALLLGSVRIDGVSANVNLADKNGDTALHMACQRGHYATVELLLLGKTMLLCDATLRNVRGQTPLDLVKSSLRPGEVTQYEAAFDKHTKLVEAAREEEASKTFYGRTAAGFSSMYQSMKGLFSTTKRRNSRGSQGSATPPPPPAAPPTAGGNSGNASSSGDALGPPPPYEDNTKASAPLPQSSSAVVADEVWACHGCTLFNQPDATTCAACDAPRPSRPSGEPPLAGATGAGTVAKDAEDELRQEIARLRREKELAEEKARQAEAAAHPTASTSPPAAGGASSGSSPQQVLCCICIDEPAECLLVPCGHQCLCSSCRPSIEGASKKECPMCKAAFTQIIKVYTS